MATAEQALHTRVAQVQVALAALTTRRQGKRPLRDVAYNIVARNRYRIFGRFDACIVPDASMRARVLE